MELSDRATTLLHATELWWGIGGAAIVAFAYYLVVRARALPGGVRASVVLIGGLATGIVAVGRGWGVLLVGVCTAVFMEHRAGRDGALVDEVAVSVAAAVGLYACLPDTEIALVLLGAASMAGLVALVLRRPWSGSAWVISAVLAATAIVDGRPRATAVIGGVAIAAIHAVATVARRTELIVRVGVAAAVVAAMALCSRVAGRGDDSTRALLISSGAVALVTLVVLATRPSPAGAGQGVGPAVGDR